MMMTGVDGDEACLDPDDVAALLHARLEPALLRALEQHVAGCSECRELLSAMAQNDALAMPDATGEPGDGRALPTVPRGEPHSHLASGVRVGRYVVVTQLGEGAMGVVYVAHDPELDRKVALKILRHRGLVTGEGDRLRGEAQAMAHVVHPNVVTVYDVGTVNDHIFIAMELVDGHTLAGWLAAELRSWRAVVAVFLSAGHGLAAAHAAGMVHRDFKPANVLVGRDGRVRVGDFGMARRLAPGEPDRSGVAPGADWPRDAASTTGLLIGTPYYMAPEQFLCQATDARTDQFSFCVALYQAIAHEHPFDGEDVEGLAEAVTEGRLRRPPDRRILPRRLLRVIHRGLATEPDGRYPSMDALLADLGHELAVRRPGVAIAAGGFAAAIVGLVAIRSGNAPAVAREPSARDVTNVGSSAIAAAMRRATAQAMVDDIGANLQVNVTVIDNAPTTILANGRLVPNCPTPSYAWYGQCFSAKLVFKNGGRTDWSGGFTIYYSSIRKVLKVDSDQFTITHVRGDLHKIETTAQFTLWKAGETKEISFTAAFSMLGETDVMPRFYVTAADADPKVIQSSDVADVGAIVTPLTDPRVMKLTPDDKTVFATAATRFTANRAVKDLGAAAVAGRVVPTPAIATTGMNTLDLASGINLNTNAIGADAVAAVKTHFERLGINTAAAGGVTVTVTVDARDAAFASRATTEAYRLEVAPGGVTIVGGDAAGAFYGLQTLAGLVPASGTRIPLTTVVYDAPRYPYRGVQIDLARNFHSLAEILKVIDQAAAYKLNSLHLHLGDDEGWRLEIPGLPELTDVGSRRCHDLAEQTCLLPQLGSGPTADAPGTGHFSTADFVEIVRAAKAHYMNVIPEFVMPGHARAAIKAMQVHAARGDKTYLLSDPDDESTYRSARNYTDNALNPCMASTYAFIGKVMDEVAKMYVAAGARLEIWHVGGQVADDVWKRSPVCAALYASGGEVRSVDDLRDYFIRKVNALAKAHGFGIRTWSDGLRKTVLASDNKPVNKLLDITTDLDENDASVNWWGPLCWWDNTAYKLANAGYKVILTSPDFLFLDQAYEADPKERGFYWAARSIDVKKLFSYISGNLPANSQLSVDFQGLDYTAAFTPTATAPTPVIQLNSPTNVIGLEGALWSETVRSDDNVDYMVFPRLLALAERAWHRGDWEPADGIRYTAPIDTTKLARDWERFANLLGHKELAKLDKAGVAYRIEVPGGTIANRTLSANVAMPGLTIQYQKADGTWSDYDAGHPPTVTSTRIRAATASGRTGRAVAVP